MATDLAFVPSGHLRRTLLILTILIVSMPTPSNAQYLTVYTDREQGRLSPVMRAFKAATGIEVKTVYTGNKLISAIQSAPKDQKPDVIITSGLHRLVEAKSTGLTQSINSAEISNQIPAAFRDRNNHWIGMSSYARAIFVSAKRVSAEMLDYEDLSDPRWRGKICTRSGDHPYTMSLVSSMIVHHGYGKAKKWLIGLRENLARKPQGNDRAQAGAIAAGICDLALVNTYYWGTMRDADEEQQSWANASRIIMPNSKNRGSHVNISGVAMIKGGNNNEKALHLISFLISPIGQSIYSVLQYAYPISPEIKASKLAASGQALIADQLALSDIANNHEQARKLINEVRFNDGPQKQALRD